MLDTLVDLPVAKEFIELVGRALYSKWKDRRRERGVLEEHKRRIASARVTNTVYLELSALRKAFSQHGWADRREANREFFDRWLSDPIVEMGWAPSGGWTMERLSALRADLENVRA